MKKIDILDVIKKHAESHRALAGSDAYSAQEAPKLEAAWDAIHELVDAAGVVLWELRDRSDAKKALIKAIEKFEGAE